jgi:hypothetical protein
MLPPTLAAAEYVELAASLEQSLPVALWKWELAEEDHKHDLAATLRAWWETYCGARPAWSVALEALDKMLPN